MISVIIPNKNGRKIITDLSNQLYDNYELIVIEDKSLRGQSWALNRGIEKATGEYLMFLDDDLQLEDNLLSELLTALEDTEHSLAYCNYKRVGVLNGVHRSLDWDYKELKKYNYISNCSLVRAKDFTGWDENIYRLKDWDAWLTIGEQGHTGIWVDKVLFTAFYGIDGISIVDDGKVAENIIKTKHNL